MAGSTGKKTSKSTNHKKNSTASRQPSKTNTKGSSRPGAEDSALFHEIGLIVIFVVMIALFCCNFGIIGPVGNTISGWMFGLFGTAAYAAPILFFLAIAFWFANEGNPCAVRKLISGIVLFLMFGIVCDLITKNTAAIPTYSAKAIYESSRDGHNGGGVLAGSISYMLQHYLETIGTVLVVVLCSLISLILLTERSLLDAVKNSGSRMREMSREDAMRRREANQARRREQEEQRARRDEDRRQREEERRLREEEKENERILRMQKKVSGVMQNPTVTKPDDLPKRKNDMHEITYTEDSEQSPESVVQEPSATPIDFEKVRIRSVHQMTMREVTAEELPEPPLQQEPEREIPAYAPVSGRTAAKPVQANAENELFGVPAEQQNPLEEPVRRAPVRHELSGQNIRIHNEQTREGHTDGAPIPSPSREAMERPKAEAPKSDMQKEMARAEKKIPKKYMFPPLSRLQKGVTSTNDCTAELKETAMRLQQTLNTFGVRVTITDISQGPSVTRYELQPEQGVKVSKIVGLADDIKLNLAATDIRIEAPIPGKAAIGIEVPNKENMAVALRDLLETKEFREFQSNLAFAVGKDIAGQVVVTDIAKMPHMLIAGATGSGKSVCINTLIMSILYKAHPDDVKLIMIDPKVVELSVYNGIPHLLIPVVTDPKKASAALHWGVSEMEDRYRKFADFNVRDLKGYNKKVESMQEGGDEEAPKKMPQIVIIVDELADLMMVSPGEVEESICRLAQLARAAGIHLIIATQRPSVDVITGLIKANMPSRVAFSVSSGVDSRTILDMNGAEKLLGKGDMLFYPQGYTKPARIQGAFVSDKEVSDVVDFLKNQTLGNVYDEEVLEKVSKGGSGASGSSEGDSGSELDELFEKAGRFIIEKDKASIGMLQRVLKVGFNRAARIMDQLCEYGVVGEEEGTKPRKILMSPEQFEQLIEEFL